MTVMTDSEQLMLELINRARLDPQAEAARYGIGLNDGVSGAQIAAAQKQPLSPNDLIRAAARDHSQWMIDTDTFSHFGAGNSDPGDRMSAAGYAFVGGWTWAENIAWKGTTGTVDQEGYIFAEHENLFRSAGHRVNTLNGSLREIGVGVVNGQFTSSMTYNAVMTTIDFARSGSDFYITGVLYDDTDHDNFFSFGEGVGSVSVDVARTTGAAEGDDTSAQSGGYGVGVAGGRDYDVTFSGGELGGTVAVTVAVDAANVKVDLVGGDTVASSGDTALGPGARDLVLLGINAVDGTGNNLANAITGTKGKNVLDGAGGTDTMTGLAGNDIYHVDRALDDCVETGSGGIDRVNASSNYTLGVNVEHLTMLGADDLAATGNGLANAITGNNGSNVLRGLGGNDTLVCKGGSDVATGGAGDDTIAGAGGSDDLDGSGGRDVLDGGAASDELTGGSGVDAFLFTVAPGSGAGIDVITDFNVAADTIKLENSVMGGLGGAGTLAADAFFIGTSAGDGEDRIIYDSGSGALYYDADGVGGAAQIQIALLADGLALTRSDLVVI